VCEDGLFLYLNIKFITHTGKNMERVKYYYPLHKSLSLEYTVILKQNIVKIRFNIIITSLSRSLSRFFCKALNTSDNFPVRATWLVEIISSCTWYRVRIIKLRIISSLLLFSVSSQHSLSILLSSTVTRHTSRQYCVKHKQRTSTRTIFYSIKNGNPHVWEVKSFTLSFRLPHI
jgi:hypothetical protein